MAQNYPDIPSTETLQNSRRKIVDRDDAVASCFSGTTFPTAGVQAGMLCLRTDEQKLYQLKSTGPDVWVVIADLSKSYLSKEEAQALFAAIGHNHDTAYQAKDADLTAVAGLTGTGLIERTGDGQAQAVPVTPAGKALLDDANAAAQRSTLGLSDAATTPVADIRAGVDQSGRVAKAGDTMTGELVAPSVKSQGTAGATGFRIADATDLAALFNKGYASVGGARDAGTTGTGSFYYYSYTMEQVSATEVRLAFRRVNYNCMSYCAYCSHCTYCTYCNCNCDCGDA